MLCVSRCVCILCVSACVCSVCVSGVFLYVCLCVSLCIFVGVSVCMCLSASLCVCFYTYVCICVQDNVLDIINKLHDILELKCHYETYHFVQCKVLIKKKHLKEGNGWLGDRVSLKDLVAVILKLEWKEFAHEGGKGTYLKQWIASFTTCMPWSLAHPTVAHILVHVAKELSRNMHQRVYSPEEPPTVADGSPLGKYQKQHIPPMEWFSLVYPAPKSP